MAAIAGQTLEPGKLLSQMIHRTIEDAGERLKNRGLRTREIETFESSVFQELKRRLGLTEESGIYWIGFEKEGRVLTNDEVRRLLPDVEYLIEKEEEKFTKRLSDKRRLWTKGKKAAAYECKENAEKSATSLADVCRDFLSRWKIKDAEQYRADQLANLATQYKTKSKGEARR